MIDGAKLQGVDLDEPIPTSQNPASYQTATRI
jgi:hypothetical protein